MRKYRFWIFEFVIGVLMVGLGIFTFIRPTAVLGGFTRFYAVMAILSGIRDIVFFCKAGRYTGVRSVLSLVASIVGIMTGVALFVHPSAGTIILSLLIPLWFISHSIFQLASLDIIKAFMSRNHYRLALLMSIIGLILGIITLFNPSISIGITTVVIALYLILTGIMSIIFGVSRLELEA